jgi:DNA-binding beta-propeller fold protein YncE
MDSGVAVGLAAAAMMGSVAADQSGSFIYWQPANGCQIFKINVLDGTSTTIFKRGGCARSDGALASVAQMNQATALFRDPSNPSKFYHVERASPALRLIDLSAGTASTVALNLNNPKGLCVSHDGTTVYVADSGNNRIVRVIIGGSGPSVLAGAPNSNSAGGYVDSTGTNAQFNDPRSVALDPSSQNLYVADTINGKIRRIVLQTAAVTTLNIPSLNRLPTCIAMDPTGDGKFVYITQEQIVWRWDLSCTSSCALSRVVGTGSDSARAFVNGIGQQAQFNVGQLDHRWGNTLTVLNNGAYIYVVDHNGQIRLVRQGTFCPAGNYCAGACVQSA